MPEVVTRAEVKNFLRLGSALSDAAIDELIDQVEAWLAPRLSFAIGTATQTDNLSGRQTLRPFRLPIVSITSITDRYDNNSVIPASEYEVSARGDQILRRDDGDAPTLWSVGSYRYAVEYVGGYQSLTESGGSPPAGSTLPPAGVKLGFLQMIARLYNTRGGVKNTPHGKTSIQFAMLSESDIPDQLSPFDLGVPF